MTDANAADKIDWEKYKKIGLSALYSGIAGAAITYMLDGNNMDTEILGMNLPGPVGVGIGTFIGTAAAEAIITTDAVSKNEFAKQLGQALKPAAAAITVPATMVALDIAFMNDFSLLGQYAAIGAVSSYAGSAVAYVQSSMGNGSSTNGAA